MLHCCSRSHVSGLCSQTSMRNEELGVTCSGMSVAKAMLPADLLCQELDVAACCKGHKLESVLVLSNDVQRLCSN